MSKRYVDKYCSFNILKHRACLTNNLLLKHQLSRMNRKYNLITFLHLEPEETPSFVLVEERSSNEAPSIVVTFPDGYQDVLVLSKFYANKQNRIASKERCHYIGHLANELTACVAMTGCVGSQDVQFTILSKHAPKSSTFKWTKDGNVELMKVNI